MGQPVGMAYLNDDQRDALARRVDQVFSAEIELPAQSRRALYEAMLRLDPQHQQALLGLGEALLELDQPGPAADAFEQALQHSPENLGAIDSLARALGRNQGESRIMQRLEALLLEQPDTDALLALAGRMCQTLALLDADEAPEWEDSNAFSDILSRAAQRAAEQNDPQSALRVHEFALGLGEYVQRPGAFAAGLEHVLGRGEVLLRLDRLIEARDAYGQFSLDYPGEVAGPNGLIAVATRMIERQMHHEAESLLQHTVDLLDVWQPVDRAAVNLVELGNGLLAVGRPGDAIRAVSLSPGARQNPHALLMLARAFSMDGQRGVALRVLVGASSGFALVKDWQNAKLSAEEGLKINPDFFELLKSAASSSIYLGDCKTALEYLSRCVRIKPGDAVVLGFRGISLARLGRFEEALTDFERAVALDGQMSNTRYGAARCLNALADQSRVANEWQTGEQKAARLQAALEHIRGALQLRPDVIMYKLLAAGLQYRLGKPDAARRGFKAVLAQQPDEPQKLEALRGKARAEGDLGLQVNALITALELPIDDTVLVQSVVNALAQPANAGEEAVAPESDK